MGIRSATVERNPEDEFKPFVDADPITKPLKVMVTVVDAATAAAAVVMTIAVDDGVDAVPVHAPLIETVGVEAELKKPGGYVKVITLPMARAPPAVEVKLKIKEALAAAKRSASLMKKVSNNTCPPKTPDAVPADGIKSALVLITMPYKLPAVALPIMKPVTVTVTPVFAAID
jgi:hypothetical protein